jgi:hypothetical protein
MLKVAISNFETTAISLETRYVFSLLSSFAAKFILDETKNETIIKTNFVKFILIDFNRKIIILTPLYFLTICYFL